MLALWTQWAHATAVWQLFWLQALLPPMPVAEAGITLTCPSCVHPMIVALEPRPHWKCTECGLIRVGCPVSIKVAADAGGPDWRIGATPTT